MNDFVQHKIKLKQQIYKTYQTNGREDNDYFKLQEAASLISEVISRRQEECQNHLTLKLSDPVTNA